MRRRSLTLLVPISAVAPRAGRAPRQPLSDQGNPPRNPAASASSSRPRRSARRPITTLPAEQRPLTDEIRATAVIKPNENRLAHVSPRIPGKAVEVKAVLGDHVEPGQVLALLDSLELGEKKSAFLQARTNLEVARRNYEREAGLFKQRISSEKDYLEIEGRVRAQRRRLSVPRAKRSGCSASPTTTSTASPGAARAEPLSHFPIRSPFRRHGHRAAHRPRRAHQVRGQALHHRRSRARCGSCSTSTRRTWRASRSARRRRCGSMPTPRSGSPGRSPISSDVFDESTRTARARVEVDNRGRPAPARHVRDGDHHPARVGRRPVVVVPDAAVQRIHGRPPPLSRNPRARTSSARSRSAGRQTTCGGAGGPRRGRARRDRWRVHAEVRAPQRRSGGRRG